MLIFSKSIDKCKFVWCINCTRTSNTEAKRALRYVGYGENIKKQGENGMRQTLIMRQEKEINQEFFFQMMDLFLLHMTITKLFTKLNEEGILWNR